AAIASRSRRAGSCSRTRSRRPSCSAGPGRLLGEAEAMGWRLLSVAFWSFLVLSSAILFPVALLIWAATVLFDRRLALLHQFTCLWASLYSWCNPAWRVHVEGREKVRPGVAYVMVANHRSFADIIVLFRLFVHFKWVSKVEMFRIPAIGWNMRLN